MARPKKIGLDYFPMDVTFNDQIQAIESVHGNDGLVWIIKFWQLAYKTEFGEVDLSGLFGDISAKNSRITPEKQKTIISDCITLGLLKHISAETYTSNGVIKRMSIISRDRKNALERHKNELFGEKPPNNSQTTGESKRESKVKEKVNINTWRDRFDIYMSLVIEAHNSLKNDKQEIERQEKYYPNVDILLSIEKSVVNFWGTEAGWKHKKRSRSKEIDMRMTLIKSIKMDRVFYTKENRKEKPTINMELFG